MTAIDRTIAKTILTALVFAAPQTALAQESEPEPERKSTLLKCTAASLQVRLMDKEEALDRCHGPCRAISPKRATYEACMEHCIENATIGLLCLGVADYLFEELVGDIIYSNW